MQRLEPRVRFVWTLGALVSALILGGVSTVALHFLAPQYVWGGVALGAVVFALALAHTLLRYRRWRFEVQEDALYLERGVLTHVRTVVPFVRIQHVDTQRNPLDRAFGLESVVVYTAGSRGADVSIPGLTPQRASDLQGRLRSLVGEADAEDAV